MITNDVAVVVTQHWHSNTSQNREPDCAACFAENQLLEPRTASNDPENQNPAAEGKTTSKPAEEVITDSAVITDLNPAQADEVAFFAEHPPSPQRSPSASACEPYREAIDSGSAEAAML